MLVQELNDVARISPPCCGISDFGNTGQIKVKIKGGIRTKKCCDREGGLDDPFDENYVNT